MKKKNYNTMKHIINICIKTNRTIWTFPFWANKNNIICKQRTYFKQNQSFQLTFRDKMKRKNIRISMRGKKHSTCKWIWAKNEKKKFYVLWWWHFNETIILDAFFALKIFKSFFATRSNSQFYLRIFSILIVIYLKSQEFSEREGGKEGKRERERKQMISISNKHSQFTPLLMNRCFCMCVFFSLTYTQSINVTIRK